MAHEQNGITPGEKPKLQQVLVVSDGVSVQVSFGACPLDVAEGLLFRALSHVQREILRAQLKREAEPKVEIATAFPRGMV